MIKNEKQLEAEFIDRLVKNQFLNKNLTPETYPLWEQAYQKSLKINKNQNRNTYFDEDDGLFLFGYNKRLKADKNEGYEDWLRFLNFRMNSQIFESYNFIFRIPDTNKDSLVDDIIIRRCARIVQKHIESTSNYKKHFPRKLYGLLLLNQTSDESKRTIHAVKMLKLKPSKFLRDLIVLERMIKINHSENDENVRRDFWYYRKMQDDLSNEVKLALLKDIGLSDFEKSISLTPYALNWHLCIRFTTTDYFSEYNGNEYLIPTNDDAVIELHLFPNSRCVIDLQWYSEEEEDHRIKYPSHKRKRVMWRNMFKYPISYDQSLKESCPEFERIEDFPLLVELLSSSFELDFGRKAELITKGIEVDTEKIKEWLSPYANYVVGESK